MRKTLPIIILLSGLLSVISIAQNNIVKTDTASDIKILVSTPKRFYFGNGYEFVTLSTALFSKPGIDTKLTVPRFTAIVNFGFNFHYDLNKTLGIFAGIGLKNLGFIEKIGDSTIKRRVYTIGVPVGLKIGDLWNRDFVFFGGGVDVPFNYRQKSFKNRGDKDKFNDWFSDRTAKFMPYLFAGYSFDPGITFKVQYYPANFFNTDYQEIHPLGFTSKPYTGYKANLLLLCLGIDIHYNKYKVHEREYQEMKREREMGGGK